MVHVILNQSLFILMILKAPKGMKKIILILSVLMVSSCIGGVSKRIPIDEGNVRITITNKHVIHEKCEGFNSLGDPIWTLEFIESRDEYEQKLANSVKE